MQKNKTTLTSPGQVSVPAAVRNFLHLIAGSVQVSTQQGGRILVERGTHHSTKEAHQALCSEAPPTRTGPARTLIVFPESCWAALALM